MRRPQVRIESDLGEQVSAGLQQTITAQLAAGRERLAAEVNAVANQQFERLSSHFAAQYDQLVAQNSEMIGKIQGVHSIVTSIQSGRVDPATIFRTAAESNLLDDGTQKKIDGAVDQVNDRLREAGLPGGLQGILPLRRR